jgi:hypothetical protein
MDTGVKDKTKPMLQKEARKDERARRDVGMARNATMA